MSVIVFHKTLNFFQYTLLLIAKVNCDFSLELKSEYVC